MIILVDSREQAPLKFSHKFIDDTEVIKLEVGDYGVRFNDGYIPPVYFERKSMSDLFLSLGKNYKRFKRMMEKSLDKDYHLTIIVEGSLSDILRGSEYSILTGESIVKKLFTLYERYGIIPVFAGSRTDMAHYIVQRYIAIGKEHVRK